MKLWLPFILLLAFNSLVILTADTHHARGFFAWVNSLSLGDKAGHFVLMGGLAFLLNFALRWRVIFSPVQLGGVIVAVFVVAEEFSQKWIPWRTFDYFDLLADFAGITTANALAWCAAKRAGSRES